MVVFPRILRVIVLVKFLFLYSRGCDGSLSGSFIFFRGINAGTRGWGCSWGSKEEQSRPEESSSKRILLTCYWYHLEITWNHLWCAILNSVLYFLMFNKLFKRTEDCSVIFSITTGETASIQGSDGFTCSSRDLFWRFLDRGHATSIWQICHNQRDFGPKDKKFVANVKNYWLCPFKFVGMALAVVAEDRQIIDVLEELFAEQVWFLKLVVSYSIALHWTRNLPLKIMVLHSIRYPYTFWFPNIYMPVVLEHYIVNLRRER